MKVSDELNRKTGIILALDVTDEEKALEITKNVADCIDAVKIGYPLILKTGLRIVYKLSLIAPVIADFKVADIPNTDRLSVSMSLMPDARPLSFMLLRVPIASPNVLKRRKNTIKKCLSSPK